MFDRNSGRKRGRLKLLALSLGTVLASGMIVPAWAQQSPHPNLDANGVDLTTGFFNLQIPIASVGSGQAELPIVAYDGLTDNWSQMYVYQTVSGSTVQYTVLLGAQYDNFTGANTASTRGSGATLTDIGGSLVYRSLEGMTIVFSNPTDANGGLSNLCDANNTNGCYLLPDSISGKTGMSVGLTWDVHSNCGDPKEDGSSDCTHSWRLTSVSNEAAYSISWTYASNSVALHSNPAPAWFRRATATLANGTTTTGTVTYANPSTGVYTITTPGNRTWRITGTGSSVTAVRRPSASTDTTTISYTSGKVSSVTRDGITTSYNYSVSGTTATMVVTDAQSHTSTVVSDLSKFRPTSVTNAVGKTTALSYDSIGRPTEVAYPEGNKIQYGYDSRGNMTTVTRKAKTGSGLADIVTSANYPTSCTDPSCNSPTWTKDALGNQTDYTYNTANGLPLTVTAPAATSGANRAQTRYSYTANSAGILLLTGVSQCQTGVAPACVGTADEVKTTIGYDANLNVTSNTVAAGNASLSATTSATYDAAGNLLTVDGPLSGTPDTTTFRYDADRLRTGAISADPDGSGALKRRAVKTTYNADGQPTVTEVGTVNGTTDTDWSAFVSAQQSTATYDANGFKTKEVVTASSTTYQVAQYSYDSVGRLECTALRMNSASWSSLPSSACTLATTGSAGPDRITKNSFDNAGRTVKVQTAYGVTGQQADEVSTSYTDNGRVASVTDAENNKTSYSYSGHDRLSRTYYPSTTKGAGTSSSTDYDELGYDADGAVTSRRLRDGTTINLGYDHLERLVTKDLPGTEPDVTYTYDLLGRMTGASKTGNALTFGYDALGRNTNQGGPLGTVSYQYDAAGRRTRMTWPDTFYVTYDYQVTGEVTAIRESGATSGLGVLASFTYDDFGRRTLLTRGNGTTTSYGFDNASQLSSLVQNLTGTTNDLTLGFTYNPASQISGNTRSNDLYAWDGHYNVNRAYTNNGLNQVTTAGAINLQYDARGNLTQSGISTYTYNSENLMTSGAGVTLDYDAALRLYAFGTTGSMARYLYDGVDRIAEYDSTGAVTGRHVFGPGDDEPLVWYVGSGTATRRWFHADERGSVVAISDDSGASIATNKYDEFGIPSTALTGRFGYTGQAWLPALGMYYYKARIYSPTLGRFMQTDPIGYGDGMNWYNYVKSNPVNLADPTGANCHTRVVYAYDWYRLNSDGTVGQYLGPDTESAILVLDGQCDLSSASSSGYQNTGGAQGVGSGHDYDFYGQIAPSGTLCTPEQVALVANFYAIPGSEMPHENGGTYTAYATIFDTGLGYSVMARLGEVQFNTSRNGLDIVNTTLSSHWMKWGSVHMEIGGGSGSGYFLKGNGYGSNDWAILGWLNQTYGPEEFNRQIDKMKEALKQCN